MLRMSKRSLNPSNEGVAGAVLPLAGPILTKQHWLLLPAAVQVFLAIAQKLGRRQWLDCAVACIVGLFSLRPSNSVIPSSPGGHW